MQNTVTTITKAKVAPDITISNGRPVVSSLDVARRFDKLHKNVLRDIVNLEIPSEFRRANFEPSSYVNQQNKRQPCVSMTRKGFVLLVMGYTGARMMQFKIAYIEAFDVMERELASGSALALQVDRVLEIVAKAANRGYPGSFIPELTRYRRMGLSCEKCAILLGVSGSAVANWSKMLRGAGIDVPAKVSTIGAVASFRPAPAQFSLFGGESA